eukprot:CAMPEP_0183442198 /NCGR_PEP_ID=MMETSP0370-20130417/87384_1 /TAXON_ID=268820 /ORGANISM="Peridinium aciculiferum, Strain PAER-2" /LENGTH=48 /DNA_ID= /DNA_START= /DNA_END= /DNA_ORIENTATION=
MSANSPMSLRKSDSKSAGAPESVPSLSCKTSSSAPLLVDTNCCAAAAA